MQISSNDLELISIHTYDEEFWAKYIENDWVKHDNTVDHCLEFNDPVLWSDLAKEYVHDRLVTPEQRQLIKDTAEYGYVVGVTIPLYSHQSPYRYGLSLCQRDRTEADFADHDHMFSENEELIVHLAFTFFGHVNFTNVVKNHYNLTDEELILARCLTMSINQAEIADLIVKLTSRQTFDNARVSRLKRSIREKLGLKKDSEIAEKAYLFGAL